jgi:hypothetical protein
MGNSQEKDTQELIKAAEENKNNADFKIFQLTETLTSKEKALKSAIDKGDSIAIARISREKKMIEAEITKREKILDRYNSAVLEAEGIQDTIALDGLTEKLGNIASVGERRAKRTQRRAAKVQKNLQQANEGRKNAEKLIDQAVSNGMEYQSPQVVEAVAAEIETNKQLQAIALREESLQASMLATPIAANPSRTAPHTST